MALEYAAKGWPGIETAQWEKEDVQAVSVCTSQVSQPCPTVIRKLTVVYTSENWKVQITYPVVPTPDYDVTIVHHAFGKYWQGTVKADGTVEGSELENFVGLVPIIILTSTPSSFEGKMVTLVGEYRGLQPEGGGEPPVTRSDWVLNDGTGEIYITGKSPDLDPVQDVGKMLTVVGTVRLSEGVPYLEALEVKEGMLGA